MKRLVQFVAAAGGILALSVPLTSFAAIDQINDSNASSTPAFTVTTILYLDGQPATASSANNSIFTFDTLWGGALGAELGYGSNSVMLSPTGVNTSEAYEAVSQELKSPNGHFRVRETRTVNGNVSTIGLGSCGPNDAYEFDGYTLGNSEADAAQQTPEQMNWASFDQMTQNETAILWNKPCLTAPQNVSPVKFITLKSSAWTQATWSGVTSQYGSVTYIYESSHSNKTNPDGSFTNPVYVSGPLTSPSIPTLGTPPGIYYWHVKAVDSAGNSSAWSAYFKDTVTAG